MSQEERARLLAYAEKSFNRMCDLSPVVYHTYGVHSGEWAFVCEMQLHWSDVCDTLKYGAENTFRYYVPARR